MRGYDLYWRIVKKYSAIVRTNRTNASYLYIYIGNIIKAVSKSAKDAAEYITIIKNNIK